MCYSSDQYIGSMRLLLDTKMHSEATEIVFPSLDVSFQKYLEQSSQIQAGMEIATL
jgi:hypothetical protein